MGVPPGKAPSPRWYAMQGALAWRGPYAGEVPERDDEWRYDPPPDYHDPTAGIGGAPPAVSALTLRAWLAALTLAGCTAGIAATADLSGPTVIVVLLAVVGLTALVDLVVIVRRRRSQTH
jgi:hypothetical protein